jgi:hypothetical protein
VKQQSVVLRSLSACLFGLLLLASCKKVNDATELGGDLIPPVDNINTFDTILQVISYNQPFGTGDTSRSISSETHFVGNISDDPLFGTSTGTLFLQLKPQVFLTPFQFTDKAKLVGVDSVVLVLGYNSTYGDTMQPLHLQVYEIDQSSAFTDDSLYLVNQNNFTYSNALSGIQTIFPYTLNDSVRPFREMARNQVRLRLNNDFGDRLLRYDSTNAYRNDSAFNSRFKGFAVRPQNKSMGNALVGVSLADTNTKLAIYYRYTTGSNTLDTAVTYFRFNSATSASANYIERDRTGSEFAAVAGDDVPDQLVYIQNTPGTYARLSVPGLYSLTNRVVHRAELVVQQVPDAAAKVFSPAPYLYLDAYDTTDKVYRTIPIDVAISPQNGQVTNALQFGMVSRKATVAGVEVEEWRFDISRYVQRVANGTLKPYDLRLSSPFFITPRLAASSTIQPLYINPVFGIGRLRVGGGNHPAQPMKLRIIYSKL